MVVNGKKRAERSMQSVIAATDPRAFGKKEMARGGQNTPGYTTEVHR